MKKALPSGAFGIYEAWKKKSDHARGLFTWPTKSYEVWMLLQSLLYLIRPKVLVEFGSGRSTYYLSEYAFKYHATLVSFEQHRFYYHKINKGLELSFLPTGVVKHAPLHRGWYDLNKVLKHLEMIDPIDFFFYDGPATPSGGDRSAECFFEHIVPRLKNVKLMIVDDIHREKENHIASRLANDLDLRKFNVYSDSDDTYSSMLFSKNSEKMILSLPDFLKKLLLPSDKNDMSPQCKRHHKIQG